MCGEPIRAYRTVQLDYTHSSIIFELLSGPKNGVFGKPCVCCLPSNSRGFDENSDNDEFGLQPGLCCSGPVKTAKMMKMTGVTRAQAWFTKGMVFCSLRITAGTQMIADPEKCFQELSSEKSPDFIAG